MAIHRRGKGDIWQGLWEPLLIEDSGIPAFEGRLTLLQTGVKHVLTHRILMADFYLLETSQHPSLPEDYIWIDEDRISDYGVPRLVELLLEKVAAVD